MININDPMFFAVLRDAAKELLAMHDVSPRVVRYVASMQKWLITQVIVALHFERQQNEACPPLTVGLLIDFFAEQALFSRNTLAAHVAEMRAYGLLVQRESKDKRVRPLQLSVHGEALIGRWLESHLTALDRLDGGHRSSRLASDERQLRCIHPLAVRRLVLDPDWSRPPASIDMFVRTESGSNILHELICKLPAELRDIDHPVCIGPLHASEISTRHTLSRGHVQRVIARAKSEGLLIWSLAGNRGDLLVSHTLLQDYVRWQSIKFKAIAVAFERGQEILNAAETRHPLHSHSREGPR
ncbi:hypothetical protein [Pararhizobium antarcticum]|uniref:Uncharacterized protein n=1 Tax=Pararhizobium antarcticum TaxID=1798805 RepID=A0A657LNW5_9HYPH|nr:hypothetical protein [Pararhizobium antarcticum]OJF92564.1 hypothetical protein AX760_22435 [Pararhizobium antarcticum]OJF95831.1 hypothetical protein AX761_16980 [Rhizobium sp. 58]